MQILLVTLRGAVHQQQRAAAYAALLPSLVQSPFSSARFSLRHSIFAQMNGCYIFEGETQNRIIREPHFLLNLSQKKKKNQKKRCLFTSEKLQLFSNMR